MQNLHVKIAMATVVVAVAMLVILMPQFNEANDGKKITVGKDEKIPKIPTEKDYQLYFCGDVVDKIEKKLKTDEDKLNGTKVFEVGYKAFKSFWLKGRAGHKEIAELWKKARNETVECSEESAFDVSKLMVCFNIGVLHKTMGKDVRKYTDKCASEVEYWENYYDRVVRAKDFPNADYAKVKEFIDDKFIEKYYEENRSEQLSLVNTCCEPKRAWRPLLDSFKRAIGADKDPSAMDHVAQDPDQIEGHYNSLLMNPCESLIKPFSEFMIVLGRVSMIIKGGPDEFLRSLKKDIRDAVFHFKYCASLIFSEDNVHEQKRSLAWNVLFPKEDYGRVNCYA